VIAVPKPFTSAPPDWVVKAAREREAAIIAYKAGRRKTDPVRFAFVAYKDKELRAALNELFRFKCAYCESVYGATQPVAIEHWRPKGKVTDGKKELKPGYYWLAADWDNLFPSCTDCNSPRNYEIDDREQLRGKGNEFPLEDRRKRVRSPNSELSRESPLLLNPSAVGEKPEQHLEFGDPPEIVRPAIYGGSSSQRGGESIRVYALDRPGLVKRRQDHAKLVTHACLFAKTAKRNALKYPNDPDVTAAYDEALAGLRLHLGADQPYLAMTRAIINRELPGAL
jgi:hypothetical protein